MANWILSERLVVVDLCKTNPPLCLYHKDTHLCDNLKEPTLRFYITHDPLCFSLVSDQGDISNKALSTGFRINQIHISTALNRCSCKQRRTN